MNSSGNTNLVPSVSTSSTLKQNQDTSKNLNGDPDTFTSVNVKREASPSLVVVKEPDERNLEEQKNIPVLEMKVPSKTSKNKSKKNPEEETNPNISRLGKVEDSSSLATVYVAAPLPENQRLAITGKDDLLGGWKKPKGSFEKLLHISEDIYIFQGVVPSVFNSPFKFVYFNEADEKIMYEGEGKGDDRTDKLLPGSMNFFIFKLKSKSFFKILLSGFSNLSLTELKQKIAVEFFKILFDHIICNTMPDWDAAYEIVSNGLEQIKREVGDLYGFREFVKQRFQNLDQEISFEQLLLTLIADKQINLPLKSEMPDVMVKNKRAFCLYLHSNFKSFKRKNREFLLVMEHLVHSAGSDFWWILFYTNRYEEKLNYFGYQKVSDSTLKILQDIPKVLLSDKVVTSRVVEYLVRWNDIDRLYDNLRPTFSVNPHYQQLLDNLLLEKLLIHKNMSDFVPILRSEFLKKAYQSRCESTDDSNQFPSSSTDALFDNAIKKIFNQKLSDVIRLAITVPNYLLPAVIPVVENIVTEKTHLVPKFSREDYEYFANLDPNELGNFPQVKEQIEEKLLKMAEDHMKSGSFQSIRSLRLILLVLPTQKEFLLDEANVVDLQKSIKTLPQNFFQNLHYVIKSTGVSVSETLRTYRKGKTKDIAERLEIHFHRLDEILKAVRSRSIPLTDLTSFNDLQVIDCLKNVGLTNDHLVKFNQGEEELRRRHDLYSKIYISFARFDFANGATESQLTTKEVLEPKEWEEYMKDIDLKQSISTLQEALDLSVPLESEEANWLMQIRGCALFKKQAWYPRIQISKLGFPLAKDDLKAFVNECAIHWENLALDVSRGTVSFKEMDQIIKLEPDYKVLSIHLKSNLPIEELATAYRNFKSIQDIRHLIGPFVGALRFFTIKDRKQIEELNSFVEDNLLKNWDQATLAQVRDSGIVQMINEQLGIETERPETIVPMKFISSLVTAENQSPLIEWLREKTDEDMVAMGRILQGTLLEAYGKLQTLRDRMGPFLEKEFDTFHKLLLAIRNSEEKYAQKSGDIKFDGLAKWLPEIETAIRASAISPSEDAKEKLAKLRQVVISPQNDTYSFQICLEPSGSLSVDEVKQAFQLLDMTVGLNAGDLVHCTRKNVSRIEQLSEVFGLVFASGCITYTFQEQIVIELVDLEAEIKRMHKKLDNWNSKWKKIDKMRLLSLFSRGYLLKMADLIGRNKIDEALSILKFMLPSSSSEMEKLLIRLTQNTTRISVEDNSWLSTDQLFDILRQLNEAIQVIFDQHGPEVDLPPFLTSYGQTLKSHFIDKTVVILNVSEKLLIGSALAAYISVTGRPIEPSRILFVTTNTDKQEIERFMTLWSVAEPKDFFIIVHIERLTAAGATSVRQGVDRVLPERRAKLLLLAQHHHPSQSTKSLGSRLGLVSDRLLEINFTVDQLGQCFSTLLPSAVHLHFFTSKLPGCGKSQQAMQQALEMDYYRIPVRIGSVEELLASLKNIENLSDHSRKQAAFVHFDVAHSVSLEFNDILLSLLISGALYDPKKAKLGFWAISPETKMAIEFASPFGMDEFPIIGYLGKHHVCECNETTFSYNLISMPNTFGQPVIVNLSNALVAAGKFLQLKEDGVKGLGQWDDLCSNPETIIQNPLPNDQTFHLLIGAFQHEENRKCPTFSALNAMATFLHRHILAMIKSTWFNSSAVLLFEQEGLARVFKLNVFDLLLKVANDSITRCWSMANKGKKLAEMDWIHRQRAMFLLGLNENGCVTGMNVVGRDSVALKSMFHASLLLILQQQRLQFQEFWGFNNLMESPKGAEVVINAMRSLLLLDGTVASQTKVNQLDSHPHNIPAKQRLQELIGQDRGYVLTGDNMTKMMFALYRIRCGLPVVAFGEAGVGKSALFRFLIQTLLGHTFQVCNVNSGTSIHDVEEMIESAMQVIANHSDAQVFLFFDEMNTADPPVIAFFKELMLDRHCRGTVLPNNLHLMAAANPYRKKLEVDKEATVGLAFRFAQTAHSVDVLQQTDSRNLVYRVNEFPLAFYDHIYDFGYLCPEAEHTYIDEICQHGLSKGQFRPDDIKWFSSIIRKSHQVARALGVDPDSAVSLRDATRAVQLFDWFCHAPAGKKVAGDARIAADLTIYLVYAFRFRNRKLFLKNVFGQDQTASQNMMQVSRNIATMLYKEAHGASIGSGAIALNNALCENLFALYVCVLNGIFLIIVGRPGSSKSLAVDILKLFLSPGTHELRNSLGNLPAITEVYFQCSPISTSSGFKALFESAQRLSVNPKAMLAMVVLDELGLADMSPEKPIKVLHSELERRSVLTSGEEQQSHYSVVALSNWVVDAAQVNRGILITRIQANKKDLLDSAVQLADSLVIKHIPESEVSRIKRMLEDGLENIVNTYQTLDEQKEIGGGHFFSMRDFFFCVKHFVCSSIDSVLGVQPQRLLIESAIRNFGGHEKANIETRKSMADNLAINEATIPAMSPLDLIVQNIRDSSKPMSIHIARHLMILNRSLIGLQLLNRHVKSKLDDGTNWNVLFGSCFPGDFQVTAVTRKLRQVEQAIRTGGVLILCHAEQLFESLYMVLNQQYWTQDEVTMTHIVLGPSIRAIALPDGPFRIIALQDTDVALNRELMSPAILSRFEKRELKPCHLLDEIGRHCLKVIESNPLWLAVPEAVKRQKLLNGYHEESFSSLALQLQDRGMNRIEGIDSNDVHSVWMRAANPMEIIKVERDAPNNPELLEVCRHYRDYFILDGMEDAFKKIKSNRMVIMTNTLPHLEIKVSSAYRLSIIQLFDVQTEMELYRLLESLKPEDLADPAFCLVIQYNAVAGPIEQFQLTKYEVEQRFKETKCRVVFVVHVDPRPVNMHWVFSFGDGWDYSFVDEIVPGGTADQHHIPLSEFVSSPVDYALSEFVGKMSLKSFKSFLLDMLGPMLQTRLASLPSSLGQFYIGVRTAIGLSVNSDLINLLQECLLAQLDASHITWNVVDAVSNVNIFDLSSSLTESLWDVFKHKISNPLAHLLIVSDVWRVCDESLVNLWCDFVTENYPDRLMSPQSSDSIVELPVGFHSCNQPFERLLASFDIKFAQQSDSGLKCPLQWLLTRVAQSDDAFKKAYFMDWFLVHVPSHLHLCIKEIPLSKMIYIVNSLFEEPKEFSQEWDHSQTEIIAALELVSIASFAKMDANYKSLWNDISDKIRNWAIFAESAARLSLTALDSLETLENNKFIQSISSIEASPALTQLVDRVKKLPQLWLELRIKKRILLFDPKSSIKLPKLQITPQKLFESLTDLVINSVVRPRVIASTGSRRNIRQADLIALLKRTASCKSTEELAQIVGKCSTTNSIVLLENNIIDVADVGCCSSCNEPLIVPGEIAPVQHLRAPNDEEIESLFQDHQKFMFFFERVAELFIQQHKNSPNDIREFFLSLLSPASRFRVSWRFLVVIVRSILSTQSGIDVINSLFLKIDCNGLTCQKWNEYNLMRALLASADQDVRQNSEAEMLHPDFVQASMTGDWTWERIRQVAHLRRQLTINEPEATADAIAQWADWKRNQTDPAVTESLLFFILRLSSTEGDPTLLNNLFRDQRIAELLNQHPVIGDYIQNLSPFSLGFNLQSADRRTIPFQDHLLHETAMSDGVYQHYPDLLVIEPDWGPFIARLAYHAADVSDTNNIHILVRMTNDLVAAAKYILPGIDNHPDFTDFTRNPTRWYLCDCGTLNSIADCGLPMPESTSRRSFSCAGCRHSLSHKPHKPRPGVRQATIEDFAPPTGIHMDRIPSSIPTFAVRNASPVVTRFSLLLNSLALMNAALNPQTELDHH